MNKLFRILGMAALFLIGSVAMNSCNNADRANHDDHEHHDAEDHSHEAGDAHQHDGDSDHMHAGVFQCPMQCEGDKTYDKAGECPECGMDLEKTETGNDAEAVHPEEIPHDHDGDGKPDHD